MKTVLITGACINTGVDIVHKFASEGYNVVFTGRDPEKVSAAQSKYEAQFPNVKILGYAINSLVDERVFSQKRWCSMRRIRDWESRSLKIR